MNPSHILAALVAASLPAGAVLAQPTLISVDLTEVAGLIAQQSDLDESLMPLSIQVPPEVAAKVCGISPRAMASAKAGCLAKTPSAELNALVKARMRTDEAPAPPPGSQPPEK